MNPKTIALMVALCTSPSWGQSASQDLLKEYGRKGVAMYTPGAEFESEILGHRLAAIHDDTAPPLGEIIDVHDSNTDGIPDALAYHKKTTTSRVQLERILLFCESDAYPSLSGHVRETAIPDKELTDKTNAMLTIAYWAIDHHPFGFYDLRVRPGALFSPRQLGKPLANAHISGSELNLSGPVTLYDYNRDEQGDALYCEDGRILISKGSPYANQLVSTIKDKVFTHTHIDIPTGPVQMYTIRPGHAISMIELGARTITYPAKSEEAQQIFAQYRQMGLEWKTTPSINLFSYDADNIPDALALIRPGYGVIAVGFYDTESGRRLFHAQKDRLTPLSLAPLPLRGLVRNE